MIVIGDEAGILVIAGSAIVAAGWGAALSLRAAVRGPEWALGHIERMGRWLLAAGIAGAGMVLLFTPRWVGLAVLYVVAVVWWLRRMLGRGLSRHRDLHGFAEITAERRSAIVSKARSLLAIGGGVAILLGLGAVAAGSGVSTVAGWAGIALGAVLGGTSLLLRPRRS